MFAPIMFAPVMSAPWKGTSVAVRTFAIALGALSCAGTGAPERHPLREWGRTPEQIAAADIPTLDVILDPRQSAETGLRFLLEVRNTSKTPITIYDPSDVLAINLTDQTGWPIALRAVPPLLLINTMAPAETRASLDTARAFAFDRLDKRDIPKGVKTIDDLDAERYVQLNPGDRFWVPTTITRVIANPEQYHKADRERGPFGARVQPEITTILPGAYKLNVSLPFILKGGASRILESGDIPVVLDARGAKAP